MQLTHRFLPNKRVATIGVHQLDISMSSDYICPNREGDLSACPVQPTTHLGQTKVNVLFLVLKVGFDGCPSLLSFKLRGSTARLSWIMHDCPCSNSLDFSVNVLSLF
jgi:hypothetical protein